MKILLVDVSKALGASVERRESGHVTGTTLKVADGNGATGLIPGDCLDLLLNKRKMLRTANIDLLKKRVVRPEDPAVSLRSGKTGNALEPTPDKSETVPDTIHTMQRAFLTSSYRLEGSLRLVPDT